MKKDTSSGGEHKGRGGFSKFLINIGVTLVAGLVIFYFELPAINLHNQGFYFFFFILSGIYCVMAIITSGIWKLRGEDDFFRSVKNNFKVPLTVCALFLVLIIFGTLFSSEIIRARAYRDLLTVEDGNFEEDVDEINFDKIPLLDKDSAEKLGDRKLGELSDMVSQFEVSEDYTQINYIDRPVRVTPLLYGDIIKWFNNTHDGIPAYIRIDMVTQNAEVVRLSDLGLDGMRYTTDEHFGRNLMRHLRFNFPTFMFDEPTFEIDESGCPYWVCPRVVKRIGLFGGKDIKGAVLVNAVTGDCEYYEDVPEWVDRVYTPETIIEQYDYHGLYTKGFLNSIFGQKNVTITTDGYNYIALKDDVYMYTGITSVGSDQSNVGFILTNQRTKETKYYAIAGATEYSAMSSAEGVVQHLGYDATFPLLLNISSEPTYFMSLKDNAGLVKMYAMVNVRQYQIVGTGATVKECEENYIKLLGNNNLTEEPVETSNEITGVISEIRDAVIEGNTVYYVRLQSNDKYFAVKAAENEQVTIANVGDTVKITYLPSDSAIQSAVKFEIVDASQLEYAITEPAKAVVPELVGMSLEDAKTAISAAGLVLGTITEREDSGADGIVLEQSLQQGTEVETGAVIDITVGTKSQN